MNLLVILSVVLILLFANINAYTFHGNTSKNFNKILPQQPAIASYKKPANPPNIPGMPKLPSGSQAVIVKQEFERFKDGGYRFFYETSDGQSREEVGFFKVHPKLGKVFSVHGSYGYIGPTKKKVFVKYTSDERGFRYENSPYPPAHLPSNIINQQLNGFKL
ncbi:hypothetical protein PVAND_006917 [Polypedilum vanderplanki]|uniref:Uncharacterized protein n=1 Tax=Polypedilum vanderplanki TaxID=319348 RepID=A0A9J6C579_POLVA|nr:hypothetical protein PVAND_006917 [Polypedilum vanderplanki]